MYSDLYFAKLLLQARMNALFLIQTSPKSLKISLSAITFTKLSKVSILIPYRLFLFTAKVNRLLLLVLEIVRF